MVNVVTKGKDGEREAIKFLQPIVNEIAQEVGVEAPALHRNQNQSALGGYDIDGLDWLALEIKRQEQLSLNAWWKQVNKARSGSQEAVVMFRQNRKPWRFLVEGYFYTGGDKFMKLRCELNKEDFVSWFKRRLTHELSK